MRRLGGVLLVLVVIAAGGFGLLALFSARDDSQVATSGPSLGEEAATECPDSFELPARDGGVLSDRQQRSLLARGNVVLLAPEPRALATLQREVAGRYDPEFAAAGQAIALAQGDDGVVALAWGRRLEADSAEDPVLREFAEVHLGRGAGDTCG